jgi:hypothetical protein
MGIQSFTPASGGLSGQTFIDQVYLTFKVRRWNRAGSPGFYRATSALNKDGFVYFVQNNGTIIQAPLNGIANVTLPFTEIRILATQFDMISLYKVSAKGTDSLPLTANYTTITSSGLYTFPTNAVGFCDALLVGGGGGTQHHSGGGGAGAIIEAKSIPLGVGTTQSVTIGAGGGRNSSGGTTTFLGHNAIGGGSVPDLGNGGFGGGGGGAGIASAQNSRSGGGGDGGLGQLNTDKSLSTWLATLGTSLTVPLVQQQANILFTGGSHNGGSANGTGHSGGGGGGATGPGGDFSNGQPPMGGPGIQLNWDGTGSKYYSVGGAASRHSISTDAANQPGWSRAAGNYGMGGKSRHNDHADCEGTQGVVIVRTWSV